MEQLSTGVKMLTSKEIEKIEAMYIGISINSEYTNSGNRYITNFKLNNKYSAKQTSKFRLEAKLGVKLSRDETVDHIDGDISNDDISNLQLLSRRANIQKAWEDGSMSNSVKNITKYLSSDKNRQDKQGDKNKMSKTTFKEVKNYRFLYDSNKITKEEIIMETGLTRRSVENFLKNESYVDPDYHSTYKVKGDRSILIAKCKELYRVGMCKNKIAKELNINRSTVRDYLR